MDSLAFYSNKINYRLSILKAKEIGERILDKMKEFVQVFVNGVFS